MYHIDKVFHAKDRSGWWDIHTDLSKEEIKRVRGVTTVCGTESFSVWVDPRFDADEVIQEIQQRAVKKTGYFPECGCDKCQAIREVLHKCEVEPKIRFGHCKPIEQCKVYLNGEEVEGMVELTEDMALVPVKDLWAIHSDVTEIIRKTWQIEDAQKAQRELAQGISGLLSANLGKAR